MENVMYETQNIELNIPFTGTMICSPLLPAKVEIPHFGTFTL